MIFVRTSLTELPLTNNSVDAIVSDAVFEHCKDMEGLLAESRRVIRADGIVYAAYGPLWHCAGGDHFSGRGGLEHVFNHLGLSPSEYRAYFESESHSVEDFQSGGRYVELDLFSKMTTREYFDAFDRTGFDLVDLVLEVSSESLAYRRAYPNNFSQLTSDTVSEDDLLIKANLVVLRPKPFTRAL